jgi:branched-chain amino acid transport system substrate-binding protein
VAAGVPLIVTTAATDGFTAAGAADLAFRVGNTVSQNTRPLAWYAHEELGYGNVAILTYDFIAGKEFADAFTDVFTSLGGTIAGEQKVPLGTPDFGPYISEVSSNADALYVFLGGADAVHFFEQAESFGLKDRMPIIGAHATLDPIVLEAVGEAAEGYVSGVQYLPFADIEGNDEFREAYQESVGRLPSFYAVDAYVALQVLSRALEAAGDGADGEALAAAIADVEFTEAPRGAFRFDDNHQAVYDLHIYETREGDDGMEQQVAEVVEEVTQQWTPPGS